ncbi:vanadium-dependent haloperoxidase [Crenothrix polyspora]|uniref:Uncharacterized protein n=1 Tax=Crenothrix polyspora TaxID=360316 RepID=A0A1R4H931_9GAMM|nr:vanadium-dependent haloperoxidase [Crenothrix polyspora]SJM92687.1 conserved exported hypothetical protein [Crenothrix polyspora]
MRITVLKRVLLSNVLIGLMVLAQSELALAETTVTRWNDAALQAIRSTKPGPPIVARALAITHTCMFDAWAAYDAKAIGTRFGGRLRRPLAERTLANKAKAISFAASICLTDLFPTQKSSFNNLLKSLGYVPSDKPTAKTDPINIGKTVAAAVLSFRHHDGSNQLGDLHPTPYSDYTGYKPVNTPTKIIDPDHWQPLLVNGKVQKFVTPHWGKVKPYALTSGKQFRGTMLMPASYKTSPRRYKEQAKQILEYTAHLTDEKKVIAEYWADGPKSELPPGHWDLFAQFVSERDHHTLDKDVKLFFAITNAIFDASIASWDGKRFYDCARPITAIHFLYKGQIVDSWNGAVDGADWQPYQVSTFPTPPFPEYGSGHSIFSSAGAETLRLFTGSDYFGNSVVIAGGWSRVEPGVVPAQDVMLYWPTFSEAAAEAGMSRLYGGIHFVDGDLQSRKIGRLVARQAWVKSLKYFGIKK